MFLPCSSDLRPSQLSSSSGDLRPEMMESETPPSAAPSGGADDPEVSSWRVSPSPEGHPYFASEDNRCFYLVVRISVLLS